MLETRAIIVKLEGDDALVEANQGGGCGHCDSVNGCAGGKVSKLFCTQPRRFRVHNSIHAHVGEEVQVMVADGALLRSALLMYMLPLTFMLAGGLAGSNLAESLSRRDAFAAIGALIGLAAGFVIAKLTASPLARPEIARFKEEL